MRIFGFEIARVNKDYSYALTTPGNRGGWYPIIHEPYTGAWQRNMELRTESLLAYHAVYACIERIASDVAKCRLRLVEQDANGIWNETSSAAFTPVLRKPNSYSNRIQFYENWVISKLMHGNTYVLLQRDNRNIVTDMYVLDPLSAWPLVAPNGDVFYKLGTDNLSDLTTESTLPASEIIHDMMTLKHHPLCGIPPMTPAGIAAAHGLQMQAQQTAFFANQAQPGGVITAPGQIPQKTADRIKEFWSTEFQGQKRGKIAVLGDGLKFEPLTTNASDSKLIEQLGMTAKMVCSSFGVPPYMVGAADPPTYNNIEALNQQYYSQTLQKYFEAIELLLDEGLGLVEVPDHMYGSEFDLDDLLRMDTATLVDSEGKAVGAAIKTPNESRRRLNLGPIEGGDAAYLQQQNYSLAALNKRDTQADPFAPKTPPAIAPPAPADATPAAAANSLEHAAIAQIASWELKSQLERLAA